MVSMSDLRYPIGVFTATPDPSEEQRAQWVAEIAALPAQLREAVDGLTDAQFETPYREGGWTVRQVVHHLADSHMQSYCRFKMALTEDEPVIKPYEEDRWAKLADTRLTPPETSLVLLEALHSRWVLLLRSLTQEEWRRGFRHPVMGLMGLVKTAELYAWHGKHHLAHITGLRFK
jgi:hypothetical protein